MKDFYISYDFVYGISVLIDGKERSLVEASRMLSDTTCEDYYGIFSFRDVAKANPFEFFREDKSVKVNFPITLHADLSVKDFYRAVNVRVSIVNSAFDKLG